MVDYKFLRSAEQIAAEAPALTLTTLEKWRFHRERLGLTKVFVEIDANIYWDTRALNEWLYEGKPTTGDYRDLRTLGDILERSSLLESKLRHWLKYRKANGLDKLAFWLYALGGTAFSMNFLFSGHASIPRRWAQHLPEWVSYSTSASVLGAIVALAATVFALRFLANVKDARTA